MVETNEKRQEDFRLFLGLSKQDCVWPEPLRWFGHFYTQFDQVARELKEAKVFLPPPAAAAAAAAAAPVAAAGRDGTAGDSSAAAAAAAAAWFLL